MTLYSWYMMGLLGMILLQLALGLGEEMSQPDRIMITVFWALLGPVTLTLGIFASIVRVFEILNARSRR